MCTSLAACLCGGPGLGLQDRGGGVRSWRDVEFPLMRGREVPCLRRDWVGVKCHMCTSLPACLCGGAGDGCWWEQHRWGGHATGAG